MTFWCSTLLWSRNIGVAKCKYLTYFKKYWGCYSTPCSGAPALNCFLIFTYLNILNCWGSNPKNPRNWNHPHLYPQYLYHPRPQNIPKMFLGIFGEKNPKIPKIKLIPVPEKSPKLVQGFASSPPRPRNSGRGRGKSGIGAPFYHTSCFKTSKLKNKATKV